MVLLLVEMLLPARRGSATGRDARVRSVACAALRAALRAPLRLHCISLLLLLVVMVLLLVEMLLPARRGSATGRDARVRSVACAALRAALRALFCACTASLCCCWLW